LRPVAHQGVGPFTADITVNVNRGDTLLAQRGDSPRNSLTGWRDDQRLATARDDPLDQLQLHLDATLLAGATGV
jgi:hypothetical protein